MLRLDTEIKNQTKEILKYYLQGSSEPRLYFNKYEENKADFYKDFNNQLIYVYKNVEIEKTDKVKQTEFDHFRNLIARRSGLLRLASFIGNNTIEGFYNNIVIKPYVLDDEKEVIPKGMKLSKAFKYFLDIDLNYWQTQYSQILNSNRISGNLCLSIHPFDYLTMSMNNNNWRSCHSLDGEYGAGTLSLMMDKSTIVAYLTNDKLELLNNFTDTVPWNSKKWRQLIHIDKTRNKFVLSKHYPIYSSGLEDMVIEALQGLYPGEWRELDKKNEMTSNFLRNTNNKIHYCDAISGSVNSYSRIFVDDAKEETKKILVGTSIPCLYCGDYDIINSECYSCGNCQNNYGYCDHCDGEYLADEMYGYVEWANRTVCFHCYESHYVTVSCENCGVANSIESGMFTVSEVDNGTYCEECIIELGHLIEEEEVENGTIESRN